MREHSIMEFALVFGLIVVSIVAVDQAVKTHGRRTGTVRISTASKAVASKKVLKAATGKATSAAPEEERTSSKAVKVEKASATAKHPRDSTATPDDRKH